ncbi:hypothetical protein QE152_g22316 [Popillia japonica]|uniref:Uncharacterized protein n=1 Tax=Popillia japonica TaxID=7064 RepID=A0AAW1KLF2_POPJA
MVGTANTGVQFSIFYKGLTDCLDKFFPLTPYREHSKQRIPWFMDEVKTIKNLVVGLHAVHEVSRTKESIDPYTAARKHYATKVQKAKRTALPTYIREAGNKTSAVWDIIGTETSQKANNRNHKDIQLTSNELIDYFAKIGEDIETQTLTTIDQFLYSQ